MCQLQIDYEVFFFPPGISELRLLLIKADRWPNKSAGKSLHPRPCAPEDKVLGAWFRLITLLLFLVQTGLHKAFFHVLLAGRDDFNPVLCEWRVWPSLEKSGK